MAVAVVNLRALRNEADWLPRTLEDAALVRSVLVDDGQTEQVVNGITGWLVAKANGQPDRTEASTRARYRRVLASLESPLPSEQRSDSDVEVPNAA